MKRITTLAVIGLIALAGCSSVGSSSVGSSTVTMTVPLRPDPLPTPRAPTGDASAVARPVTKSPGALDSGAGPEGTYTVEAQPAAGTCHYRYTAAGQPLPDPRCTPGAISPAVNPNTLDTTICLSGYTTSVRPPTSVTNPEKADDAASYGYAGSFKVAEYDHLIPLELGGDPNDPRNLWVEPPSPGHRASSGVINPKDAVERRAKSLVCSGTVGLAVMQRAIAVNWTTALAAVGHPA